MRNEKFEEQRTLDNKKLSDLLFMACDKYNLRMMQLIAILNKDGDYFNEEPSETIKRVLDFGKYHFLK